MIDISNTSIIIHFRKDSDDRSFNLKTITTFLRENLEYKQLIIVNDNSEVDEDMFDFKNCDKIFPVFIENSDHFKKSLVYNTARTLATGEILCFYDVDILIEPKFLKQSQDLIIDDKFDHIYPFNGSFFNIRKTAFKEILNPVNFQKIKDLKNDDVELASNKSPGGCNMISTKAFDKIGGYDINFIGWGFEDTDFYERSCRNNRVTYLEGESICWHLDHASAIRTENPHYQNNLITFIKNNRQ